MRPCVVVPPPQSLFAFVVNYHYGESWSRSGNTHPKAQLSTLGVLPEQCLASLRSRAIVSQERITVYCYVCFDQGIDHPLNTFKTAYKRFLMIIARD